MEIRRMTEEDVPGVARLEAESFSKPWSERTLLAELHNPGGVFFVALGEDGELMGYAGMHCVLDEGYIGNIAVKRASRRQGVGSALLGELLAWARARRMGFVTLEVRPSNLAAVRLYEKLGFGLAGRRKNFYAAPSEDALLMTAFLTSRPAGAEEAAD